MTTFRNPLADPLGTRHGPPLVRGPQFENRWYMNNGKLEIHGVICQGAHKITCLRTSIS